MIKFKNSKTRNCDETQKLKLLQYSTTQIVTAQIVKKFKLLQNSNSDKTKSVREKNSKTQNVTKIQIVTKLENSNYDLKNLNYDNSNNSNCDKLEI